MKPPRARFSILRGLLLFIIVAVFLSLVDLVVRFNRDYERAYGAEARKIRQQNSQNKIE